MRRSYHHGDLRKALVDATLAIVRHDGPAAVTLRDVAKRAGVSEAAPYHHFQSKSHLLLAVAAEGYRALGAHMTAAAVGATDARERLVALGTAYVEFALAEPGYFRLLFGAHVVELVAHPDAAVVKQTGQAAAQQLRDGVAAFLTETKAAVPQRDFERVLWSQIHGLAWLVLEQEFRPEPSAADAVLLARHAIELLLAGASAPAIRRRPRGTSRTRSRVA